MLICTRLIQNQSSCNPSLDEEGLFQVSSLKEKLMAVDVPERHIYIYLHNIYIAVRISLVDFLGSSGWPPSYIHMGSFNYTWWVILVDNEDY